MNETVEKRLRHPGRKRGREIAGVILILAALFCIIYFTVGFYYQANDDISMHNLAAGTITGVPDGHIVFLKYAIGVMIAGLYRIIPNVDWYGLTLLGCVFLSLGIMGYKTVTSSERSGAGKWTMFAAVLFLFGIFVYKTVFFEFTTVAGILSASAVFLLITGRKLTLADYIVAWCLMLLAALIRVRVFYMALPLCGYITILRTAPAIRTYWVERRKAGQTEERKKQKEYLIWMCAATSVAAMLFAGIWIAEKAGYSSPEWSHYAQYKRARSQITDYYGWPTYSDNKEFWDAQGFTEEEHACLNMYAILPNMSADKVIEIAGYAAKEHHEELSMRQKLSGMKTLFKTFCLSKNAQAQHIATLALLAVLLSAVRKENRGKKLALLGGIVIETGILAFLLYRGRLPFRVSIIIDYHCLMALLGILLRENSLKLDTKLNRALAIAVLITVCTITGFNVRTNLISYREKLAAYSEEADYIEQSGKTFAVVPGTMSSVKKFTVRENNCTLNTVSTRGWSTFSPWYAVKYEKLQLNHEKNILFQDNVFLFTHALYYADLLNKYYQSAGFTDGEYTVVDTVPLSDGRTIYVVGW